MEQFVSQMAVGLAKELGIELLNLLVIMALAEGVALILAIKSGSTLIAIGVHNIGSFIGEEGGANDGHTAAIDAAAGAAHYLDEVILALACADIIHENLCVLHAAGNGDINFHAAQSEAGFLDAFEAADSFKLDGLMLLALKDKVSSTKSSFHNAAGDAEDNGSAGVFAHEILIEVHVGQQVEADTGSLNHVAQFANGENSVNILDAVMLELLALLFVLLGSAGHDRDNENILGIYALFLGIVALEDGTLHLVGRFAGGNVTKKVAIIGFCIVDPTGRAGSDHGKLSAILDTAEKLGGLFHDGEVSCKVGVINLGEAQTLQSGYHLAGYGRADGHTELFAETCADSGSGLNDNMLALSEGHINFVDIGLSHESTGGANAYALAAHDAGALIQSETAGGANNGFKTALLEAENAVAVGIFAALDAAAAENALAGVSYDGGGEVIIMGFGLIANEHIFADAGLLCNMEQLALAVFSALLAVLRMVTQQQLNAGAAGRESFGRVDENFHAFVYGVYAGSHKTSCALNLNKAYAAGAAAALAMVERA